jgi:hypothetical protein
MLTFALSFQYMYSRRASRVPRDTRDMHTVHIQQDHEYSQATYNGQQSLQQEIKHNVAFRRTHVTSTQHPLVTSQRPVARSLHQRHASWHALPAASTAATTAAATATAPKRRGR